jgi:hypothetical protein
MMLRKEDDVATDRDCSICLTEMALHDDEDEEDEQEKTLTLACHHRFHSACVGLWTSRCETDGGTQLLLSSAAYRPPPHRNRKQTKKGSK